MFFLQHDNSLKSLDQNIKEQKEEVDKLDQRVTQTEGKVRYFSFLNQKETSQIWRLMDHTNTFSPSRPSKRYHFYFPQVEDLQDDVSDQRQQLGEVKEDVQQQGEKLTELEHVVDETVEKVEEIDHKVCNVEGLLKTALIQDDNQNKIETRCIFMPGIITNIYISTKKPLFR